MDTSYQAHGKSEDRAREALKKPCCQRKCKRAIAFRLAMQLCVAFWSLSKGGQDSLPLGHGLSSVSNLIHQRNFQNKSMMFVIVLMNSEGYGACRIRPSWQNQTMTPGKVMQGLLVLSPAPALQSQNLSTENPHGSYRATQLGLIVLDFLPAS